MGKGAKVVEHDHQDPEDQEEDGGKFQNSHPTRLVASDPQP